MLSINNNWINGFFQPAVRLILAIVFLYAAIMKGMDFAVFVTDMKKSPLLEPYNTVILAVIVLSVEVTTAVLLTFKKTEGFALYLSFFIMLIFSLYLSVLYFNYENAPCSCGGILGRMSYPIHIAFNFSLTVLSLLAILIRKNQSEIKEAVKPENLVEG
jgi:hypothetical protein